jgi:hypothetical protein
VPEETTIKALFEQRSTNKSNWLLRVRHTCHIMAFRPSRRALHGYHLQPSFTSIRFSKRLLPARAERERARQRRKNKATTFPQAHPPTPSSGVIKLCTVRYKALNEAVDHLRAGTEAQRCQFVVSALHGENSTPSVSRVDNVVTIVALDVNHQRPLPKCSMVFSRLRKNR